MFNADAITIAPPLRLGYHGSTLVARRIVRMAGRGEGDVRLTPYDIADPFRSLREGGLDIMIVKFGLREIDLAQSAVLFYEARAAIVAASHALAGRESVSVEELSGYDAFECPGAFPGYIWDEVVPPRTPAGRAIHRRRRANDIPQMMAQIVETGAVHLSLASVADVAPPAVRVVAIHDLPPAPVALAFRGGAPPPEPVRRFVAAAEAEAAR